MKKQADQVCQLGTACIKQLLQLSEVSALQDDSSAAEEVRAAELKALNDIVGKYKVSEADLQSEHKIEMVCSCQGKVLSLTDVAGLQSLWSGGTAERRLAASSLQQARRAAVCCWRLSHQKVWTVSSLVNTSQSAWRIRS